MNQGPKLNIWKCISGVLVYIIGTKNGELHKVSKSGCGQTQIVQKNSFKVTFSDESGQNVTG